jgi:acetylornithine/N-succinyldiaminopimelate aminotransferase
MTQIQTRTDAHQHRWQQAMMNTYGTPPLALASGRGSYVTDVDGHTYLDFIAGIAVSALGHAHPALIEAVTTQVARIAHTSNLVMHEPGIRLAERLIEIVGQPSARVFFTNDGTEANECALKIARLHRPGGKVVSTHNSFHGRTLGSLSITGNPAKRIPFEPLPGPVSFVAHGDVSALAAAVDDSVSAVFLETTQGEGGIVPSPQGYLAQARQICTDSGALLVIDEVQSGVGRTGDWFASLAAGVVPDIITVAKGLGGGLPIGACIGIGAAAGLFTPGLHGSTFGGNPVSCAAALAVLDHVDLGNVRARGEQLRVGLQNLGHPNVSEIRGSGLWLGIVLDGDAAEAEGRARANGLLVNAVKPNVLRLAPPLIVSEAEVFEAIGILSESL